MRVYLPGNISDIELLEVGQNIPGRVGYALLPQWAETLPDSDPELLEEELVYLAGAQTLAGGQRIVIVAELPAELVAETTQAEQAMVQVTGEISPRQIQALFGDDMANKSAILAGSDPAELDLTWFGPTEILNFKDFLTS